MAVLSAIVLFVKILQLYIQAYQVHTAVVHELVILLYRHSHNNVKMHSVKLNTKLLL